MPLQRAVGVMVEECNAVVNDTHTQKADFKRFFDTLNDISVQNATTVCASESFCTLRATTLSPKIPLWHSGLTWTSTELE
jgi:hypothetical protein